MMKEYSYILGIISIIDYPIAVILILFPGQLVYILWGDNWLKVSEYLPYFGLLILTQGLMTTIGNIYYLLEKEKTNFYVGAVNAILLVIFIAIGSIFSVLWMVKIYALSYLIVNIPINVYYGFIKTFGFEYKFVLKFWLPKVLLSLFMLLLMMIDESSYLYIPVVLYGVYIIINQFGEIEKLVITIVKGDGVLSMKRNR